jgi:hypothetical protein
VDAGSNPAVSTKVFREVLMNCDACGKPLEAVFPGDNLEDSEQADNALNIGFAGGYGMFIDPIPFGDIQRVTICHECAHALCDAVPWIERLLDPEHSHTHRTP